MTSQADFVAAQARAERVAQAFGTEAPPRVTGESELQYRVRLLRQFQPHSRAWAPVELHRLGPDTLGIAEDAIYGDAIAAAHDPKTVPEGCLREVTETDRTGRKISRFVGSPEAAWGPFKAPARLVTGWPGAQQMRVRP